MVGVAEPGDAYLRASTVLQLCLLFGSASLMSIGGGNSVVPEIELQAVGHISLADAADSSPICSRWRRRLQAPAS